MRLPAIDPHEPPSLYKRAITPVALGPVGQWYLRRIAPRIDPPLARLTRGALTSVPGIPILLLSTTGAKSGLERTNPLVYFSDGDRVILMASNYGGRKHPAWLHNVRANPEVTLQAKGRVGRYRGEEAIGEERERLWELAKSYIKAYSMYDGMTAGVRTIPVVVLTPLDPA